MNTASKHIATAARWRRQNPRCAGGVVVIFQGEASGWMNALRDPQGWEPGCIAVDEHGNQWQAMGGDPYHGAERWEPIHSTGEVPA